MMKKNFLLVLLTVAMSFMLVGCAERLEHSNMPTSTPKPTVTLTPEPTLEPTVTGGRPSDVLATIMPTTPTPTPLITECEGSIVIDLYGLKREVYGRFTEFTYENGLKVICGDVQVALDEQESLTEDVIIDIVWFNENGEWLELSTDDLEKAINIKIKQVAGPMTQITLELEEQSYHGYYEYLSSVDDARIAPEHILEMMTDDMFEECIIRGSDNENDWYYFCNNWTQAKKIIKYACSNLRIAQAY